MKPPRFWSGNLDPRSREAAPLTRVLATPLASLYAAITARRIAKTIPAKTSAKVICVGNLSVGGTGKSPIVAALRGHIEKHFDMRVATLSRGYGGSLDGPLRVEPTKHTATEVGDEPLMLAQGGESWIGKDRAAAGLAMANAGVSVILMDDGHQNPRLYKDFSVVVFDSKDPIGNGYVIPKGPLREPPAKGLARANAAVLMGTGPVPEFLNGSDLPLLRTSLVSSGPPPKGRLVAFAGIGRPEKLFKSLEDLGCDLVDAVPFPDHHPYTDRDLTYLRRLAAERGATLVTTEKDYMRLARDDRQDIGFLPVEAAFEDIGLLDRLLSSVLKPGAA